MMTARAQRERDHGREVERRHRSGQSNPPSRAVGQHRSGHQTVGQGRHPRRVREAVFDPNWGVSKSDQDELAQTTAKQLAGYLKQTVRSQSAEARNTTNNFHNEKQVARKWNHMDSNGGPEGTASTTLDVTSDQPPAVVVPAAKRRTSEDCERLRHKPVELQEFQLHDADKAQVQRRGGDLRPATRVQFGDGTVARQEEEADIALPAATTVEVKMNVLKRRAGPAWTNATQNLQNFMMETSKPTLERLQNTHHMEKTREKSST